MGRTAVDPLLRYQAKIDQRGADDCWPWTAARFTNGYGAFRLGDRQMKAHRFGYEALIGPIPDELRVCHTCDNPACQNPQHWFLGTDRDNAHDRERKGRGRYGTIGPLPKYPPMPRPQGEQHRRSKLTEDAVREIRRMYTDGYSQDSLAERFGVTQKTISLVVRRATWAHIA